MIEFRWLYKKGKTGAFPHDVVWYDGNPSGRPKGPAVLQFREGSYADDDWCGTDWRDVPVVRE